MIGTTTLPAVCLGCNGLLTGGLAATAGERKDGKLPNNGILLVGGLAGETGPIAVPHPCALKNWSIIGLR